LTKTTYDAIGNRFRTLWGEEAGWAHSVLFTADLRSFSERLTVKSEAETEAIHSTTVKEEITEAEAAIRETTSIDKGWRRLREEEPLVLELQNNALRKAKRRKYA
jgi:N-glycosylase/DNA lyase